MKISRVGLPLCAAVFFAVISVSGFNASAEEGAVPAKVANLREMPLLTGDVWLKMTQDEKVAFIWGVGHVATIERESAERYPELKRESFAAKLCEGIAGMPMNGIAEEIDGYYRENPGKTSDPVMMVIWDKIVKPKLKTGNAELPLK